MLSSIENIHNKLSGKVSLIKKALVQLSGISITLRNAALTRSGKKYVEAVQRLDSIHINLALDIVNTIENSYQLSVISILTDYYKDSEHEEKNTREFYRVITSENFVARINDFAAKIKLMIDAFHKILATHLFSKPETKELEYRLDSITDIIEHASKIEIHIVMEKRNYEICKCGSRMIVVPELSELHCPNPSCAKIKTIIGAIFRDDQFYPQDGQKSKHGGYDTSRHCRFWMERLQALESKTFDEVDINNIDYVITRDGYDRKTLICENMREILKDPLVSGTHLNDHVPLLVKTFGGVSPPTLNFHQNKVFSKQFNKLMRLHDIVNPGGGNKPYYPYFIYRLIEHEFKNDLDKLRLLDYIHLQSRETVIKNDKLYQQMCDISGGEFVYSPTDPDRK